MESFLQVSDLTKSVGDRILFADVTFGVFEGDKIGIIAKNGTGKSTLLSILAGKDSPDSGSVIYRNDLRVGYLEQTPQFAGDDSTTVLEACLADAGSLASVIAEYESALPLADSDPERMARAIQQMDAADAWTYENRLRQLLTQLRITDLSFPVRKMSGGQQKRIALARVILGNPDMLILDEPTNHLDIDVVEWLEQYLTRSRVTLLMVTHDRYFLDRVCSRIIEIDRGQTFAYDGNYDYYLRRRAERIEAMTGELAKARNLLRKEQEWMRRQPQARAGKARYRINAFYNLRDRASVSLDERNVNLDVNSSYIGSKIFEASHVSKRFGDKVILDDFTYTFARYEKLGIVGQNGVGKSTFIKMLQGLVGQDSGQWNVGETVRFGYYSQEGISFNPSDRVIDAITRIAEEVVLDGGERSYSPMQFLQRFLFTPADQQKRISSLSGGERCRLHLASVLMRSPNFLILDEPTNDLDIVTLGILEEYLRDFRGCLIVISHDRFFLDSIVDHLFVMEGNGVVRDFPGNYSEWRRWRDENAAQPRSETAAEKQPEAEKPRRQTAPRQAKLSFKERKELEEIEKEMEELNSEIAAIESRFNSGEVIDDAAALSARYNEAKERLDDIEFRWLELSEKS
ncbi:MAG: ABC-F family ATP-binding cassette domain-containing protein [Clostridium sp.]|nr:ABC-F family ATP-binding cassette domain-containing protein [Clostridium sp.]